jgi:glycerophosphoryl diester phosphodiesterase
MRARGTVGALALAVATAARAAAEAPGAPAEDAPAAAFFAHRGLGAFAPENTLLAIRVARERGFGKVELDVRTTKDDRIIVFHDETLERFFGDRRAWCDVTFDEVASRELGSAFLRDTLQVPEAVVPRLRAVDEPWLRELFATRVSTLEEVIATFGTSLAYHLDVKRFGCVEPTTLMLPRLVDLVRRFGLEDHVWVESTDLNVLMEVRLLAPRLKALLWRDRIFEESDAFLDLLRRLGITSVDAFVGGIDPTKRARLSGFTVHTFTVNSPQQIAEIRDVVDYIITDLDIASGALRDAHGFFNERAQWVRVWRSRSEMPPGDGEFVVLNDAPPFVAVHRDRMPSGEAGR